MPTQLAKRQERGYGVNPWTTHNRFIISQALLRDEAYAASLRDWLGDFAGASLFILDEAHNAAPASGARYAVDSKLTHSVRDLAPRFEHKLLLSATPHNGHSRTLSPPRGYARCRPASVSVSRLAPPRTSASSKTTWSAGPTRSPIEPNGTSPAAARRKPRK